MKILFACSEFFPLIRTDDVADFAASLTRTIGQLSHDIRIVIPAYPAAVDRARPLETVTTLEFSGCEETVRVLKGQLAGIQFPVYLIEAHGMFSRHGHPYVDANGQRRVDNLNRYTLFSQAISMIALNHAGLAWKPDVVHCNDWQTGLVPALLAQDWNRPATVFSAHRIADEELTELESLTDLKLPNALKTNPNCQVDGKFSALKAGIAYSDIVVSSSENFHKEFETLPVGKEFQQNFTALGERFISITPALDDTRFNPVNDQYIKQPYDHVTFDLKAHNKAAMQSYFNQSISADKMSIVIFDEVTELKDDSEKIQADVMHALLHQSDCQLFICTEMVQASPVLNDLKKSFPDQVVICNQPEEKDLHILIAGADAALFSNEQRLTRVLPEACWHYGTVPVIGSNFKSLAHIVEATTENLMQNRANAYLYKTTLEAELLPIMLRMLGFFARKGPWWKKFASTTMQMAHENRQTPIQSAQQYLECYQFAIDNPVPNPDLN